MAELRADYRGMSAMFFGPILPFDAMMEKVALLEEHINMLSE